MPAVRAFALYAGMALLVDFLLQITCFVSLLALDTVRQTVSTIRQLSVQPMSSPIERTQQWFLCSTQNNRLDICCFLRGSKKDSGEEVVDGILYKIFKVAYVPLLLKKWVRVGVMIAFFGLACTSIAVIPHIEIGLDQELSMPEDSFVLKYFQVIHQKSHYRRHFDVLNKSSMFNDSI